MTPEELSRYYANLLALQYKTQPNAYCTIENISFQIVADFIYQQVRDGFSIDTAIGDQLDLIATYVGVDREIVGFNPAIVFLSLPEYSDVLPGSFGPIAEYTDAVPSSVFWKTYLTVEPVFILTDDLLRDLIKIMVRVNKSDLTLLDIDVILDDFFGVNAVVTDNEDMTITYTHLASDPNLLFDIMDFLEILPRPAGVSTSVVTV